MFSSDPPTMPEVINTSKQIYGFDPRSLGGCVLWLDGADSTTVYTSVYPATTTRSAVGGAVQWWQDKSGQGNHFSNRSASTATYYPTYVSGGGVFIANAASPSYTAGTFILLQSVNTFTPLTYYTVFSVVNSTVASPLPTVFSCPRSTTVESRSPHIGLGASFSLGSPTFSIANSRFSIGDQNGTSIGEQIAANTTTVLCFTSGRTSNTTSLAGTRITSSANINYTPWTTCAVPAFIGGCFYIFSTSTTDSRWFNGNVYETIVFNAELTLRQCQEVEGYLSWKWGRQSALPTTHPFKLQAPISRNFTPIDIPGCVLWLDGADLSTITPTGGTTVTGWTDKSGNAYNATLATGCNATAPSYNATTKAVGFVATNPVAGASSAGNALTLPQGYGNALVGNTATIICAAQRTYSNATYPFQEMMAGSATVANSNLTVGFYNDQMLTDEYGTRLLTTITAYAGASEPIRIYGYTLGKGTTGFGHISNGTVVGTGFSTGTDSTLLSYNQPEIGRRYGATVNNTYTNFNLFELIVYAPALTTVQRQAVEGYLAWKWNLTASLSVANSLTKFPPSSVWQFKPTDINSCILWVDGDDPAGTGTRPASGSTVTSWVDKSGLGNNLTGAGTPTPSWTPSLFNGCGGIAMSGSSTTAQGSYFSSTSVANVKCPGNTCTFFIVCYVNSSSVNSSRLIATSYTGQTTGDNADTKTFAMSWSSSTIAVQRSTPNIQTTATASTLLMFSIVFDGTNMYLYKSGVLSGTGTPGSATGYAASTGNFAFDNIAIGRYLQGASSGNYSFNGNALEYIMYTSALGTTQRQAVEGYLSSKWGIQLVAPHAYYAVGPSHTISDYTGITPSNIPGLLLWSRADTLSGANGSSVGNWPNSGSVGTSWSCTGTQSNAVLNGRNVINFTTAQTLLQPTFTAPTAYTFIHLERQTPGTAGRIFLGATGNNELHGYWNGLKQAWFNNGWLTIVGGGVSSTEYEWSIVSATRITGGAFECRWNGTTIATGTTSAATNLSPLGINTGSVTPGETSTCQVAEVILYGSVLTTAQIVGIEEYLRQKWGLGVN